VDSPAQSTLSVCATSRGAARHGFALFAALALLGFVGLLVGGAFAAFRLAERSAGGARGDVLLNAAADNAIGWTVSEAPTLRLDTLPLGVAALVAAEPPNASGVNVTVSVTRLPRNVLWLVVDAQRPGLAGGRRRVNLVARWREPAPMPPAAIVARGDVRLGGGVVVASDTAGDADCRPGPVASVVTAPGSAVTSADSLSIATDAAAQDSAAYLLTARQLQRLGGASVVRVAGDTTIAGGAFEGILIVDGALTIGGPFSASGLVVSRGPIAATAGGLAVTGAIMSFAPRSPGRPAIDLGPATLRYSPCVIAKAVRRVVPLRPVRARSWAELF